ncbi:hypothetical protein GEMRC1_000053 [Eukaryota sp. GEM-RC1]
MRDKSRGDLIGPWLSSQEIIMDFTAVDPCNSTSVNKILDENYSALETAERKKLDRYDELISKMNSRRHNPLFSILLLFLFMVRLVASVNNFSQILAYCVSSMERLLMKVTGEEGCRFPFQSIV